MRTPRKRVRPFFAGLLLVMAAPASADVGVGFFGQATRYADQPNRNLGAAAELSLDRGRTEYFTELSIAAVSFGRDFMDGVSGTQYRGGVGVRHIARRISKSHLDVDLAFEGIVALQDIEWSDGSREVRPELDAGFQWRFTWRDKSMRISLRAFFTPSPTSTLACRGPCTSDDAITSGYMTVMGFGW